MSSCFPLKKQLRPSKKAWRSFISRLQPKLRKLRRSRTIKQVTNHLSAILLRRSRSPCRLQHKKRAHTKKLHQCQSFAPMYVDELFRPRHEPTVVEEEAEKMGRPFAATSSPSEASCSVDTRAEVFIAKFKEDMRLQRQKSLEKYQEMLARGV